MFPTEFARTVEGGSSNALRSIRRVRSTDGSEKHLIALSDGHLVESVYLPAGTRRTVCVSSQVGCALDCSFCATGRLGFRRNLTAEEIMAQVRVVQQALSDGQPLSDEPGARPSTSPITNVVFMGMGEPFYNYDNVLAAADGFASAPAFRVAPRRITISTAGVLPQIERYIREDRPYKLAISITSALADKRDTLMPINRRYPIADLRRLLLQSPARAVRRVMLEVPLLGGINDGPADAEALLQFSRGLPVRVNLIPWNSVEIGLDYRAPERSTVLEFQRILRSEGTPVFIRKSLGSDIQGACGQLAANGAGMPPEVSARGSSD